MNDRLKQLFESHGKKHTLISTSPITIEDNQVLFFYGMAPVNLFAVKKEKEERRHFIAHFEEGILFPFFENGTTSSYKIEVVSESETILYLLDLTFLSNQITVEEELCKAFTEELIHWIYKVSELLFIPSIEGDQCAIEPKEIINLEEGSVLLFKKSIVSEKHKYISWIHLLEGSLCFLGNKDLIFSNAEGYFPLTTQSWFVCREKAKVQSQDTYALVKEGRWQEALKTFSWFFLISLEQILKEKNQKQEIVLQSRTKEEESRFFLSLKKIISIFAPISLAALPKTDDPLEQALHAIALFMKIEFVFPKKVYEIENLDEKLQMICDASGIRKRKVKLSKEWWRKDQGPLLGFNETTKRPIALLNASSLRYDKVDAFQIERVSKHSSQDIADQAYMFYIPLDSSITTGKDIVRYYFKNHAKQLVSLLVFSLIGSLIAFFPPIATKLLFNYAVPESNPSLVLYLTVGLIYSSVGFAFFYFLRNISFLRIEGIATHLLQCGIWDRILKLPAHFFRRYTRGNLLWRIMSIDEIRTSISGNAANIMITGVFSLLFLVIMLMYSPLLTAIAFMVTVIGGIITTLCCMKKVSILRKSFELQGKIRGVLLQIIAGVGKLRVAGAEKSAFSYWAEHFAESKLLQMKAQNIQNIASSFSVFLPILATWSIYVTLLHWIGIKQFLLPDFLAFNIAYGSFVAGLFPLQNMWIELIDLIPLWERTKVILQEPLEEHKEKVDPGVLSGQITIDEVVFGYDPTISPIVNNVTIKINPREFVAIVGSSGSGKSTLVRLLLGFEQPQVGAIYFDGKDLSGLDMRAVRRQMGVVFQREGIMAGSIYDNLICGGFYTLEQIQTALKLSEFEEDLNALPMGLHTVIPMNGETLSGGQKQRLLLARALLASPAILIFDEATSALDNQTQARVSANIANLSVTRVVVAQRLSTIRQADKIYVLEKGQVVQEGTFDELSNTTGVFAQMLTRQKL